MELKKLKKLRQYFVASIEYKDIIIERTWWTYKEFLEKLLVIIPKEFKPNTILAEIWDLISNKQKDFMKTKMVDEVLWFIKLELFSNK